MNKEWRNELITKGAAFDELTEIESHYVFEDGHDHLMRWAKTKIFALPPKQPEIIRCRDCKYYILVKNPWRETKACNRWADLLNTREDDYCSYAERREE